eukprot:9774810-Karenia_brevis.AAC.1
MDLPVRVNNGAGAHYKAYGLHTGSIGRVTGVKVHEEDAEKLKDSVSAEVTLDHLPKRIFMKPQ